MKDEGLYIFVTLFLYRICRTEK